MSLWQLSQWAEVIGAQHLGEDRGFDQVCTDSRRLNPGDLFVALSGPNFDGHDFASEALAQGAAGVMVRQGRVPGLEPAILVEDPLAGMSRFAAHWFERLSGPVMAITGSNGKTTVRALLAAIAESQWPARVLATQGNLNNEIGLPLTLLRRRDQHYAAVLEMGANHHGEIARLGNLAQPDIALITNAGPAHLEGFGDVDGVARAKGELIEALAPDGIAVLNADDPRFPVWQALAGERQIVRFGQAQGDVHVLGEAELNASGVRARVHTPAGEFELKLALPGSHNLLNALAAAAAAVAADIPPAVIARGLASVQPEPGRLQPVAGPNGSLIVNDSYNANPASLKVALEWLGQQGAPRWLLLGDMGELGSEGPAAHRQAGEWAKAAGVDRLFTLGPLAREAGQACSTHDHFASHQEAASQLAEQLHAGVTLLVKGSRSMALEKVIAELIDAQQSLPRSTAGEGA